jgi:hypothetical protein
MRTESILAEDGISLMIKISSDEGILIEVQRRSGNDHEDNKDMYVKSE